MFYLNLKIMIIISLAFIGLGMFFKFKNISTDYYEKNE